MNEKQFFQLMDGMRETHIAEAAGWKYRQTEKDAETGEISPENEISALFDREQPKKTENKTIIMKKETEPETNPKTDKKPQKDPSANMLKYTAAGILTAAAALVLVVGGLWRQTLQEHADSIWTQPGMSGTAAAGEQKDTTAPQDTADSGESTAFDAAAYTVPANGAQLPPDAVEAQSTEMTVPAVFEGQNFIGGSGELRPLNGPGSTLFMEDDDYYYAVYYYGDSAHYPTSAVRYDRHRVYENGILAGEEIKGAESLPYMISDGESFYEQPVNTWGVLRKLEQDGSFSDFLPNSRIREDIELNGDNLIYDRIIPLNDHRYYLYAHTNPEAASGKVAILLNMIYTPETDAIVYLPENMCLTGDAACYDAEQDLLYLPSNGMVYHMARSRAYGSSTVSEYGEEAMGVHCFDCATGTQTRAFPDVREDHTDGSEWAVCGDALYYLVRQISESRKETVSLHRIDMTTMEDTLLADDTDLQQIICVNGALYGRTHVSVGDDTLIRLDADGSTADIIIKSNAIFNITYSGMGDYVYVGCRSGAFAGTEAVLLHLPDAECILLGKLSASE
ncbi:MAG TPA: hypothetical protein DCG49_10530 [Ruminococcus sp.]|nr:hypothetical protein [Ruminococcus sp.]